jgi:hypothetical protein
MEKRDLIPSDTYPQMLRFRDSQTKDRRYVPVPVAMYTSPNLLLLICQISLILIRFRFKERITPL